MMNTEETLDSNSSNSSKILFYGCQIFLNFYDHSNNKFIAFSDGFNKNKMRLRRFDNVCQNGEYIRGLFKIYPSFSNKEFLEIKNRFFKDPKQLDLLSTFEKRSIVMVFRFIFKFSKELQTDLPKQTQALEEENQENLEILEKLKGTPVKFGDRIQLLHHFSNKYLFFDKNQLADFESENLK